MTQCCIDSMTAHPDVWLLVQRLPAVSIAACRSPTSAYPLSVGIGTALLSMWFLVWQTWAPRICTWVISPNARTASRGVDEQELDAGLG
jgi:hypothetical protein